MSDPARLYLKRPEGWILVAHITSSTPALDEEGRERAKTAWLRGDLADGVADTWCPPNGADWKLSLGRADWIFHANRGAIIGIQHSRACELLLQDIAVRPEGPAE